MGCVMPLFIAKRFGLSPNKISYLEICAQFVYVVFNLRLRQKDYGFFSIRKKCVRLKIIRERPSRVVIPEVQHVMSPAASPPRHVQISVSCGQWSVPKHDPGICFREIPFIVDFYFASSNILWFLLICFYFSSEALYFFCRGASPFRNEKIVEAKPFSFKKQKKNDWKKWFAS